MGLDKKHSVFREPCSQPAVVGVSVDGRSPCGQPQTRLSIWVRQLWPCPAWCPHLFTWHREAASSKKGTFDPWRRPRLPKAPDISAWPRPKPASQGSSSARGCGETPLKNGPCSGWRVADSVQPGSSLATSLGPGRRAIWQVQKPSQGPNSCVVAPEPLLCLTRSLLSLPELGVRWWGGLHAQLACTLPPAPRPRMRQGVLSCRPLGL